MLGILIPPKYIQKELEKPIKSLLRILIVIELNSLCEKNFYQENCENTLVFSIYISDQKFENSIDFLLAIDENKSHYQYIKNFTKQRIKTKSIFERVYIPLKVKMY